MGICFDLDSFVNWLIALDGKLWSAQQANAILNLNGIATNWSDSR